MDKIEAQKQILVLEAEISKMKQIIDSSDEQSLEDLFLSMINGCEIRIVKERYPYSIFYKKNGEVWFEQDLKNEWFWCSYKNVWSVFEIKYQWNYEQIQAFIKTMLEKHLGLGRLTPLVINKIRGSLLEKHLGLGRLTPQYLYLLTSQ